jgi:hypothetical protein
MNKSELRNVWEQRITDFMSSGKSASKWCAANDISIHQFWYWKKRINTYQTQVCDYTKWLSLPNCNCKDALKILNYYIERKHNNYVVEADTESDINWFLE